jgi:hypothetical protein
MRFIAPRERRVTLEATRCNQERRSHIRVAAIVNRGGADFSRRLVLGEVEGNMREGDFKDIELRKRSGDCEAQKTVKG